MRLFFEYLFSDHGGRAKVYAAEGGMKMQSMHITIRKLSTLTFKHYE
jgi:hypothetical protein